MEFEKKLNRLQEIVTDMEKGDLSLEDSLKFFEEGVKLSRDCQSELSAAELKVKKLIGKDAEGNFQEEDFEVDEESDD